MWSDLNHVYTIFRPAISFVIEHTHKLGTTEIFYQTQYGLSVSTNALGRTFFSVLFRTLLRINETVCICILLLFDSLSGILLQVCGLRFVGRRNYYLPINAFNLIGNYSNRVQKCHVCFFVGLFVSGHQLRYPVFFCLNCFSIIIQLYIYSTCVTTACSIRLLQKVARWLCVAGKWVAHNTRRR